MGFRKTAMLVLALLVIFALAACGSNETKEKKTSAEPVEQTKKKETKDPEKAENQKEDMEIATTIEEIIKEKSGKYSANGYNKAIVHRDLDKHSFQDKDSFQVYNYLLGLMNEGEKYEEFVTFAEEFNPNIETALTKTPEGKISDEVSSGNIGTSNIAILLDASGSMAAKIGGKTKMELAKQAIEEFVASMPEDSNISLRVYGHKGSNKDSDKTVSCGSTELVYGLKPYEKERFKESLGKFEPTGWTPIAKAINETKKDFEKANLAGQNIIYVVSDGIETCEGDPVKAAKDLHDSNIQAMVNIIGFDVDNNGQKQLKEVAEAGGGQFETVNTAEQFKRVWEKERVRLYNEWSRWSSENYNQVSSESSDKLNALYGKKSDFTNLMYDEKNHLADAVYYLRQKEQISAETREEVESLIQQRRKIIEDYIDKKYKDLIKHVETEGKRIRKEIDDKGRKMREKYSS
ncbi:VWA domain-containing protein [Neobacillus mesonae]|uniref:VWA domain-containing protein n=1 Tax=Neobacillus mesonae TaxID=1193713 RepID=UPI00204185AA|nr:VWA domain-containing protein [Neobacillus mesonae]MCM3571103.1 VWA domain-containing protein [Neobacillus mesonae]